MNEIDTTFLMGPTWRLYKFWCVNAFTDADNQIWKFNADGTGLQAHFTKGVWQKPQPCTWYIQYGHLTLKSVMGIEYYLTHEPNDELGMKNAKYNMKNFCRCVTPKIQSHDHQSS